MIAQAGLINPARPKSSDAGFTLVEVLVAMTLSIILGGMIVSILLTGQSAAKATTTDQNLNQEARVAVNRLVSDIAQAIPLTPVGGGNPIPAIVSAQNPDGPGYSNSAVTSVTFNADFNGDGCVAGVASQNIYATGTTSCTTTSPAVDPNNPDTETFCWDPNLQKLFLIPGGVNTGTCQPSTGGATAQPLLSGRVSAFKINYQSRLYRYDKDANGITTWWELDQAGPPVGNQDGSLNSPELDNITALAISITMTDAGRQKSYATTVALRNLA